MFDWKHIEEFDPDKQTKIRADIAERVRNGYELRFLVLTRDGTVLYDREAVTTEAFLKAFRKDKPEKS